jgi:hypothetical protein
VLPRRRRHHHEEDEEPGHGGHGCRGVALACGGRESAPRGRRGISGEVRWGTGRRRGKAACGFGVGVNRRQVTGGVNKGHRSRRSGTHAGTCDWVAVDAPVTRKVFFHTGCLPKPYSLRYFFIIVICALLSILFKILV